MAAQIMEVTILAPMKRGLKEYEDLKDAVTD